jgi:hypothetical protein
MANRAGQFGVSWKSLGGLCHGYGRTARSVGAVAFAAAATTTWPDIIRTATGVSYLRSEVTTAMITDGLSNT